MKISLYECSSFSSSSSSSSSSYPSCYVTTKTSPKFSSLQGAIIRMVPGLSFSSHKLLVHGVWESVCRRLLASAGEWWRCMTAIVHPLQLSTNQRWPGKGHHSVPFRCQRGHQSVSSASLSIVFVVPRSKKNDSWCFTDLRPIASDLSTSKIRSRQWTQGKSDKAISPATVCPLLWPARLLSLLVTVAKNGNRTRPKEKRRKKRRRKKERVLRQR